MRNNKQFGISGKGYYIALILCAAAIGISGYLYHQNTSQAEQTTATDTTSATVPAGIEQEDTVEVLAASPTVEPPAGGKKPAADNSGKAPAVSGKESADSTAKATEPSSAPAAQSLKTAVPLDGEEISSYSMDCLSYNQTTRDWRVHNGVDIAAPEGTEVCAAADGTVYTTYEDDTMGNTVVIRHTGGYTTRYSSLDAQVLVKPGDQVKLGQTIGHVGSTALVETTLGSHIHFSVSYHDTPMDPADFLSLG